MFLRSFWNMTAKCPRCGNHTAQGDPSHYPNFLKLAEAGQLKLFCGYCAIPWEPPANEQKTIAENLQKRLAA
jgi:hypothetical protein